MHNLVGACCPTWVCAVLFGDTFMVHVRGAGGLTAAESKHPGCTPPALFLHAPCLGLDANYLSPFEACQVVKCQD